MTKPFRELQMYNNFNELADDVLQFAHEILPHQMLYMLYLSAIEKEKQLIFKIANKKADIPMTDGMILDLNHSLCSLVDFEKKIPLVLENIPAEGDLAGLNEALEQANVRSYLGMPIVLTNGEAFGTLCAINDEVSLYEERNIELLQRIVRLFLYYLELERFAWKDVLTGLYNRRYLSKHFEDHPHHAGALFFLDLDGFKRVNDVFGHEVGDRVLQEVARRLQQFAGEYPHAHAVRLGGDEFVLHFAHQGEREEWEQLATRILMSLSIWESAYRVSTSIGILMYSEENDQPVETLLQQADVALYAAKASGKNTYQFYKALTN